MADLFDTEEDIKFNSAIDSYRSRFVLDDGTIKARHCNSDRFKYLHHYEQGLLEKDQYGLDVDFAWVSGRGRFNVIAVIDHKQGNESLTWSGVVFYNHMIRCGIDVFIVTSNDRYNLKISRYLGGNPDGREWRNSIKTEDDGAGWMTWARFAQWQKAYRAKKNMQITNEIAEKKYAGESLLKVGRSISDDNCMKQGAKLIDEARLMSNGYGSMIYV